MPDANKYLLCQKLCRHNQPGPNQLYHVNVATLLNISLVTLEVDEMMGLGVGVEVTRGLEAVQIEDD